MLTPDASRRRDFASMTRRSIFFEEKCRDIELNKEQRAELVLKCSPTAIRFETADAEELAISPSPAALAAHQRRRQRVDQYQQPIPASTAGRTG